MALSQSALLWLILGASALALLFAVGLARGVLARDRGTAAMQRISNAIQEGAEAYLGVAVSGFHNSDLDMFSAFS